MVAAGILVLIAALYVGPLQKELHLRSELSAARNRVSILEKQNRRLHEVEAQLHTKAEIVRFARACGWIFPNEQAYVVKGLTARSCR